MSSPHSLYKDIFNAQRRNQFDIANCSYKERIKKLNKLQKAIEVTYREEIHEALYKDLGKPKVETELSEIFQIVSEIKHAKKYLHKWMRKQKVKTPLALLGASSYYQNQPKGVFLIISPWNFPFNLTFGPLVSAISAGNTVIIKPSEVSVNSSALMAKIIKGLFDENEIALIQGDVQTSTELLKLPFNHIFFYGLIVRWENCDDCSG